MLDEIFAAIELLSETLHSKDKEQKPDVPKPVLTVRHPNITKRILSGRHPSIETKPTCNKATGCTHCSGWGSVLKQKTIGHITMPQVGTGTSVSKYNYMTGKYEQIYVPPKYIEITPATSGYEPCPFCSGKG